jgi:uncharacterized protein (TIGR02569 family)
MVPEAVLAAFGVPGAVPVPLLGGQGTTWRAGDIVLKPAGAPHEARWVADLYSRLSGPGFRVPRPVRAAAGDWVAEGWVAEGWVAWQWVPGDPAGWSGVSPRWPELIAVSRAFLAALAGIPAPSWLGRDGTPWTVADQVAWGERDPGTVLEASTLLEPAGEQLRGQVRSLLAALRPVDLPAQLVHGDLAGNVLFADGEPPAVIDFAPYWRPAGLAIAVAAVDALLWSRAHPAILGQLAGEPELDQLLARALVYRLVTEIIARDDGTGLDAVARAGQPVTDLVLARLTGRPQPAIRLDDPGLAGPPGYTGALREQTRLADGRTVFVKAAGPGADLTAELIAYESIGPASFMPRLIAVSRDPSPRITLEALPADGWVNRWTPQAVADTEALLTRVHATEAPAALPRWTDPGAGGPDPWLAIARHPARLLRMHVCGEQWLCDHLAALSDAAGRARRSGDKLVHGDVHSGNLCYRDGGLVLVDWATAAAGNPWFDYHSWLVAMAAEGGPPPHERQGPGAAGHAALIAADQALLAPSRDSDLVLFDLRRQRLTVALTWAARLLGLIAPEFP